MKQLRFLVVSLLSSYRPNAGRADAPDLPYLPPTVKRVLQGVAPVLFALTGLCAAEIPRRITSEIKDSETFSLMGSTRPMLAWAQDEGEVSGAQALPDLAIHFAMNTQQREDLDQLLRQQQTPGAAQFRKFLTPEEYSARFGPNSEDVAQVAAWLESQGFSDVRIARSRTFISFTGTAAQVQTAFHTPIHRYTIGGETHYANASDPLLPKTLEGMVESVRGLHDFRKKPQGVRKRNPQITLSGFSGHYLVPDDFATIYNLQPLYQAGLDGMGVKIAVAGQSNIQLSDIRAFRKAVGLPPNDPTIIVTGIDPGLQAKSGDQSEADLDVEWAGAIARSATIVFVTSKNVDTSITYAIDNNVAPILTISYGSCEANRGVAGNNTEASWYKQANAQGITVIAAAGDRGAASCDSSYPASQGLAVLLPASSPHVTGIGGTTFNEGSGTYWNTTNNSFGGSARSYIPEVVWNESSPANGLSAGGGGASIYNVKPAWQAGNGVPNDGKRDVPDLSLAASPRHDGLLVCDSGDCVNGFLDANMRLTTFGGTSAGAPAFAGIMALLVQALGPQGNINPNLYALAASSVDAFHDITSGNNIVACTIGTPNCTAGSMGFSAGIGYDQATGLGSVDVYHLISEWTSGTPAPVGASQGPLSFVPITPCRVVDTRNAAGAFGGPGLPGLSMREFDIPNGTCNIPTAAVAYALNVTVVPSGPLSYLSIWPSGQTARPLVSTLNSDGRIKANAAIVPAGANGGVNVYVTNPTHLILDISGYFVPTANSSGLQFFPLAPCRIADTRVGTGSLGGPFLKGGLSRDFPILSSACHVPSNAQAYSLNLTVVPHQPLIYLAAWPTGQGQPPTSVLNAPTGGVTANAAIIPAGTNGSITAYGSSDTELVIDINGYFAPAEGGLSFYTLTPCRVIDTRNPAGSPPFSGTIMVNVTTSGCGSPATAQAYALNATVVPSGPLSYLTLWPANQAAPPVVSTLNADPNTVTSNMAILPTTNGAVDAYAAGTTHLILDISGYFAP
jgi:Pro-kumamolisin, activation domain